MLDSVILNITNKENKMKFPNQKELKAKFDSLPSDVVSEARIVSSSNEVVNWSSRTGGVKPIISVYEGNEKRFLKPSKGFDKLCEMIGTECAVHWLCQNVGRMTGNPYKESKRAFYSPMFNGRFFPFTKS